MLAQDSYYKDLGPLTPEQKSLVNFDHPDAFDNDRLIQDLDTLLSNRPIDVPEYDYVAAYRTGHHVVMPQPLILVEGLFLFHLKELRDRLDFKIFIHAEQATRIQRIRYKDIETRHQPEKLVELKIRKYVLPMHQEFIEPFSHSANMVINNNRDDAVYLGILVEQAIRAIESKCTPKKQQEPLSLSPDRNHEINSQTWMS